MTRPTITTVPGDALRHISQWARGSTLGGIELHGTMLLAALDAADAGAETAEIDTAAALKLFEMDFRAHGYGTKRALRSDRDDCAKCAACGRAIEELKPMAGRSA